MFSFLKSKKERTPGRGTPQPGERKKVEATHLPGPPPKGSLPFLNFSERCVAMGESQPSDCSEMGGIIGTSIDGPTTPQAQSSTSYAGKAAQHPQPRVAFKTPQYGKVNDSFQSTAVSRLNTASRVNSVSRAPLSGIRSVDRSFVKRDTPTDVADNVKILVRVRPFNERENNLGEHSCLTLRSEQRLSLLPHSDNSQYTFDHVLKDDTTQSKLFEVAGRDVVDNCLDGYNSCIFAYGQTGSGKTHTMLGQLTQHGDAAALGPQAGLTPRIFEHILKQIDTRRASGDAPDGVVWECRVSFLEIYNECITDLLNPEATQLAIREDLQHGIYVEGVTEQHVLTVGDALAILQAGTQNRHVGETRMNRESSRSHCVLTASLSSRSTQHGISNTRSSRLNLVDLAGSEQQKASGASGERLREASNINKSLSILGRVINTLAERQRGLRHVHHIPYRDSKLTFLLQDSLGGNSKTVMIANVSPSTHSIGETLSTLRFAQRAKRMGNRAHINEDTSGDAQMLRQEVVRLKMQIAAMQMECPPVPALMMPPAKTPHAEPRSPGYCFTPSVSVQGARKEVATAVSPHATAVKALVDAVERAQAAEQVSLLRQQKCDALEALLAGYEKEKLKKQMVDKFREAQMKKLEQAIQSGRIDGAQELTNATINALKAKVAHSESQRESAKVCFGSMQKRKRNHSPKAEGTGEAEAARRSMQMLWRSYEVWH